MICVLPPRSRQAAVSRVALSSGAHILEPHLVIWPSRDEQPLLTWLLNVPCATVIYWLPIVLPVKSFIGGQPADPATS